MRALIDILSYPFQLVFLAPAAILGAPRWLKSLSVATRVALVVFVFMLLFTAFSAAYYLLGFQGHEAPDLLTWARKSFFPPLVLTFLTPPVVYLAVRFWLEGQVSRFPDIDAAWKEGVEALEKAGISLTTTPIFLILGLRDERSVRALMRATGIKYTIQGVPEGNKPIHFYAAVDEKIAGSEERLNAVYVFAVDACRSSKLHLMGLSDSLRSRGNVEDTVRADSMRGTMVGGAAGGDVSRGTSVGSGTSVEAMRGTSVGGGNQPAAAPLSRAAMSGTMMPGGAGSGTMFGGGGGHAMESAINSAVAVLPKAEAAYQGARLEYLCHLIAAGREPLCPLNGVMMVTPFQLLRRGDEQCRQLAAMVREDLRIVQKGTRLRCAVVSLIGGMEHERGFLELIRRVGSTRARDQRLGSSFKTWNPATIDRLQAMAALSCGTFEDNIYSLFKEEDGYNKAGNDKLYSLICKTRGKFIQSLEYFLTDAFALQDIRETDGSRPMLFSGCYFAATGEVEGATGFIRSLFEQKLYLIEQDNLQWTETALRDDATYQGWARLGMLVSGCLVLVLIGVAIYSTMNK
ncbi:type VI secretion protein IcmF/TssM N-terminal domain-containing protein [Anatilimnocola sp. NA78]|uniref:type VI secretion protein IcmF/TssM N-terminal domain-containing protein n=1 Tax=Anatilimnocola sp. NA78 TaxID=3415683 RepID=UPI003CE4A86D